MDDKDWIYACSANDRCRYLLGTKGAWPLYCIGLNPSTARPGDLDPTMQSVQRLSYGNGFDSWIMANLYPQRATNPNNIHKRCQKKLHQANLEALEQQFVKQQELAIWAAWGTLIEKRPFLKKCLYDIYELSQQFTCNWVCIGKISKAGHPHHPLYLRKDSKIKPFDMEGYMGDARPELRDAR